MGKKRGAALSRGPPLKYLHKRLDQQKSDCEVFLLFSFLNIGRHPPRHTTTTSPRVLGVFGIAVFDLRLRSDFCFSRFWLCLLQQLRNSKSCFLRYSLNFLFGFCFCHPFALFQLTLNIFTQFFQVRSRDFSKIHK